MSVAKHETKGEDLNSAQENFEKKFYEAKQRNQKLTEYIQNQEAEKGKEQQALKAKLEESKSQIRKLEDENISLKFQLAASKEKEASYLNQIQEMKTLLRKYYNKAHSNESFSSQASSHGKDSPSRSYLQSQKMKLGENLIVNTKPKQSIIDSPKTAGPVLNTTGPAKENISLMKKVSSPDNFGPRKHFLKGKSFFSATPNLNDSGKYSANEDTHGLSDSIYNTTTSREGGLRKNFEDARSSSIEHKVYTMHTLSNGGSPTKSFEIPQRKVQTLVLDYGGIPKTLENLLEEGYLRKFNLLSQNIVALNIKPEISKEALNQIGGGTLSTIADFDASPKRRSCLKYVHKTIYRKPTMIITEKIDTKPEIKPLLFQDFLLIGVDKEDIKSFSTQNPNENHGVLKPRILYSYPRPPTSITEPPQSSIPEFSFPFGVKFRKIRLSPSLSNLNSVIFESNDYELKSKSFIFPLLSSNPIEEQPDLGEVVEKSNSNHLLYIICIYFKDYIDMSDKTQPKTLKNSKFFKTEKLVCFVTYYPFINFFFEVLTTFIKLLKVERENNLMNHEELAKYENLDENFSYHYFKSVVQKNLKIMRQISPPNFSSSIAVTLQGLMEIPIQHQIDSSDKAWTWESTWACIPVFSYFALKDLLWIFSAFMLEKKLVFLSQNIHLLTATLSVILSLIKPFKYPFPLIFNLPEVLLALCDAPGAALIGINKGMEFLEKENLFQDYPSCVFICLDEEAVVMDATHKPEIPHFDNLEKNLFVHYTKLNVDFNSRIFETKKSKNKQAKKTVVFSGNQELRQKCMTIMELFKASLEKKIISIVPPVAMYTAENDLDYPKIRKKVLSKTADADKKFMKEFVETQIFMYFIEQFYHGPKP